MKNIDFRQIKSIKTPESWIENAINIPQKNKKIIQFYLKPYFIASVASLVLCGTICLTVFFSTSNNAIVPIAQSTTHTTNQTTTQSTENTPQTDFIPIVSKPTDASLETTIAVIESTAVKKPTQHQIPTTNTNTEPTEVTSATVAPTEVSKQTEPIIQTEPTEVTTIPGVTEAPTVLPVLPTYTKPMETDPESAMPSIPESPPPTETYVSIYLQNAESYGFSTDNIIYCHIEALYGGASTEMFTDSERAYWNRHSGYVLYQAKLNKYSEYCITFYDEYGNSHTSDIIYYGGSINI